MATKILAYFSHFLKYEFIHSDMVDKECIVCYDKYI
jgi:hypothetical protein